MLDITKPKPRSIADIMKERGLTASLSQEELADSHLAESVTIWEDIK
jgi:hypothetical protein